MSETKAQKESPIVAAKRVLDVAGEKMAKADYLRTLGPALSGAYRPVSVDSIVTRKAFGDRAHEPNWSDELLRDALIAGCCSKAGELELAARKLSEEAADLLKPPPVMRGLPAGGGE